MAVTTIHAAGPFEPVYSIDGDNVTWVLDSSNKALCSMKYVTDVYLGTGGTGATAFTRLKLSPNTTDGLCTVSLNRVLEDFISYDLPGLTGFAGCPNSSTSYYLAFGEETDGTLGCTGASFSVVMGDPVARWYVFNGTLQYGEDWNPFHWLAGATTSTTVQFLTNAPTTQDVKVTESSFLYFILGATAPAATGGAGDLDFYLRVRTTASNGVQENFFVMPDATFTAATICSVAMGPVDLNAAVTAGRVWSQTSGALQTDPIVGCTTVSYAVKLGRYQGGGVTQYDFTETRTYNVSCECERYTPFRFAWLNRRGGFDTYTFRLKSTRNVSTSSKEYTRFLSRYNAGTTAFGYSVGDRGRTVYSNEVAEAYTVVSTWQSEAEHQWLAELFTSTAVFLVDGGQFFPIVVTKNSVEVRDKDGYGNRLLSHTIDFVRAYPTVVQRA